MIQLPEFQNFEEQQKFIQDHIGELLLDAIEEFNNIDGYSKALEVRFRQLRPYVHDVVMHYLEEIEKGKTKPKKT